jgi:hypothetical protein
MRPPDIVGDISEIETIAIGGGVKVRLQLVKRYGFARWCKRKGVADIRLLNGAVARAEIHWYEAHGFGKREMKVKRFL